MLKNWLIVLFSYARNCFYYCMLLYLIMLAIIIFKVNVLGVAGRGCLHVDRHELWKLIMTLTSWTHSES